MSKESRRRTSTIIRLHWHPIAQDRQDRLRVIAEVQKPEQKMVPTTVYNLPQKPSNQ